MKRIISLLAAFAMLAALLSGCGSGKKATDLLPTETPTTEAPTTEAAKPDLIPAELGSVQGSTYLCPFFSFGCTVPDSFVVYGNAELQSVTADVQKQLKSTDFRVTMMPVSAMDMQLQNPATGTNANVLYQEMSRTEYDITAEQGAAGLIDYMLAHQKDTMIDAYKASGMDVTSLKRVTVNFMGDPCPALESLVNIQGVELRIVQLFAFREDSKFLAILSLTSPYPEELEDLLDCFYIVE